MTVRAALLSLVVLLGQSLAGCTGHATRPTAQILHVLAPTGALRVALYTGTPTSLLGDNDLRGVGYELGKALAQRLRVPFRPQVFARNADVLDAVTRGDADVAFTNASAERANRMLFTQPYLLIDLGYLARAQVPVTSPADVDRAGLHVGVTARSSSDAILSVSLVHAQVVRADSIAEGIRMMSSGTIDLYATNKATLYEMADKLPGARVLEGNWGIERHAVGIPLGRERGLPYLRAFIADAMASGLVQAASARAGLRGAKVADAAQ
jgi:polar amino acid transport system substrate-binding protein